MIDKKTDSYIREYIRLTEHFPNLVLGGSLALILHGYRLDRPTGISDIDVVSPFYVELYPPLNKKEPVDLYKQLLEVKSPQRSTPVEFHSGQDIAKSFYTKLEGVQIKVELILDPKCFWMSSTYDGHPIKVQTPKNIWQAKFKYALMKKGNYDKHVKDILALFQQTSPREFNRFTAENVKLPQIILGLKDKFNLKEKSAGPHWFDANNGF